MNSTSTFPPPSLQSRIAAVHGFLKFYRSISDLSRRAAWVDRKITLLQNEHRALVDGDIRVADEYSMLRGVLDLSLRHRRRLRARGPVMAWRRRLSKPLGWL